MFKQKHLNDCRAEFHKRFFFFSSHKFKIKSPNFLFSFFTAKNQPEPEALIWFIQKPFPVSKRPKAICRHFFFFCADNYRVFLFFGIVVLSNYSDQVYFQRKLKQYLKFKAFGIRALVFILEINIYKKKKKSGFFGENWALFRPL